MAICRCEKGHFYDTEKYSCCPICMAQKKGIPYSGGGISNEKTIGLEESDQTIGYVLKETDAEARPVVGWLVCVRGVDCGRDWRLSEGRNDIGTQMPTDILLHRGSRLMEHRICSVVFDGKHRKFILSPGKGTLVYYNGTLLWEPVELQDGDEIGIEEYVLCFQSFCGIRKNYW